MTPIRHTSQLVTSLHMSSILNHSRPFRNLTDKLPTKIYEGVYLTYNCSLEFLVIRLLVDLIRKGI